MHELEFITDCILAIQSDENLKSSFIKVLQIAGATQQVRVQLLLNEVEKNNAPEEIKKFILMLSNDQLAQRVYAAIT